VNGVLGDAHNRDRDASVVAEVAASVTPVAAAGVASRSIDIFPGETMMSDMTTYSDYMPHLFDLPELFDVPLGIVPELDGLQTFGSIPVSPSSVNLLPSPCYLYHDLPLVTSGSKALSSIATPCTTTC
jgi:hypothetical protein